MSIKKLLSVKKCLSELPLLCTKDLARRYCKSLRTIHRWHRDGTLPKPVYIGRCHVPMWIPEEIEANEKTKQLNGHTEKAGQSKAKPAKAGSAGACSGD